MRRISVYDRIGWCAVALIAAMLAPSWPYAAFALVASVVAIRIGVKFDQWRSQRARLAADAAFQHQALMEGSDYIGVYGRYQPGGWSKWSIPQTKPVEMPPGGTVIIPATPWPPERREEQMHAAFEKALEQHAGAFDRLADL